MHVLEKTKSPLGSLAEIVIYIYNGVDIRHIDYESAVIFAALFMGLIIYALYYKGIICLNKDIEEGYKYVYSTKITEKAWRGDNQFEMIITERPKKLNKLNKYSLMLCKK